MYLKSSEKRVPITPKGSLNITQNTENTEIELLLEGVYRSYGFDFREYARSSIRRRVKKQMSDEKLKSISELQAKILHDEAYMERFLTNVSINVTSMFRDPSFYLAFREKVVPVLKTYPSVRVWVAGCSTGEEVYSLAILLHQENLLKKSRIYGTDINQNVLNKAKSGIYDLENMKEYSKNHLAAGGKEPFSNYYNAKYGSVVMKGFLKRNLFFHNHNLATDASFNEFNVILCRNVMIYFDEILQNKTHKMFYESLCKFGFLVLGRKETIKFSDYECHYETIDASNRIYRRVEK